MSTILTGVLPAQVLTRADGKAASHIEQQVLAEQIRHIYRQTPAFVPTVFFGALITIIILWPVTSPLVAVTWCLWIWLLYGGYWLLYRRWRKADPDDSAMPAWATPYIALAWLSTLSWGLAGVLFFYPDSFVHQAMLLVLLTIGSAAIMATSTVYSPTFYPVVLMLTPLSARMAYEGGVLYLSLAAGLLVFTLMLIFLHRNTHRAYAGTLRQRFLNEALAEEMTGLKDIAERANTEKSRFLASASHDLRQPLHALGLFLGELRERIDDPVMRDRLLQQMGASIEAMTELFDALLDMSRFDTGAVQPELRNFRVDHLLQGLEQEYTARAAARGLTLRRVSCNAVIRSDPLLLRRILRNLIENAIRYTETGGIVIGCRRDGEGIKLQVCDSGIGIAEQQLEKIFSEFYQLNNPERDRHKGLGLGLAVVKQLAGLLGHEITVRSQPGKGCLFSLRVPSSSLETDESVHEIDNGTFTDRLESACVLIVDDDDAVREGSRGLLEVWGCVVLTAATIEEALHEIALSSRQPDVMVTDFRLRDQVSGIQVINRVRSSTGMHIPAIMITGDTAELGTEALRESDITLLHKPVNPGRLGTLLRFLLAEKLSSMPEG
ncbi:MAG TPA: response regulator [Gammaproteobacteria bacterium]|nr:response regulator [Gammaproteobacteria bacterium]